MKLRSQLKQKEEFEKDNDKILQEIYDYRSKYCESQKKQCKAVDQVQELQGVLESQIEANKGLKSEMAQLKKEQALQSASGKESENIEIKFLHAKPS